MHSTSFEAFGGLGNSITLGSSTSGFESLKGLLAYGKNTLRKAQRSAPPKARNVRTAEA